ncbi:MAG: TetR/AcrR family transcriptional regulator [Bacilli bacterium]
MSLTKNKIIEVVTNYIKSADNIEKISIKKIAEEAGIGKSTVYEHFKSKEELIDEAYISLIDYYQDILKKDIIGYNFEESLKNQIGRVISVMSDAKLIMEAIFQNNSIPALRCNVLEKIESVNIDFQEQFSVFLNMGINEGVISKSLITKNSKYIIKALMSSLSMQYVSGTTDLNNDEIIDLIYDSIVFYLK